MFKETEIAALKPSWILALNAWFTAFFINLLGTMFVLQLIMGINRYAQESIKIPFNDFINSGWLLLVPLFTLLYALTQTLVIRSVLYTITDQRVIRRSGLLSRKYSEIELIRVRDFEIEEPFSLRMLNLGNLRIYSAEQKNPILVLGAQPNITKLRDTLRDLVLKRQSALGYREVGIGGGL